MTDFTRMVSLTREEALLVTEGARWIASYILHPDEIQPQYGVPVFDGLEDDEKLVALHELCLRIQPGGESPRREAWCDAALYVALKAFEEKVEMAESERRFSLPGKLEYRRLSLVVFDAYRSRPSRLEFALNLDSSSRSEAQHLLVKSRNPGAKVRNVAFETVNEMLWTFEEEFFHDVDFLITPGLLAGQPSSSEDVRAMLGIRKEYSYSGGPSCPPQAVRAAIAFFKDEAA